MTATDWAILVPAIVGCLGALGAWLRAETAVKTAKAAKATALDASATLSTHVTTRAALTHPDSPYLQ